MGRFVILLVGLLVSLAAVSSPAAARSDERDDAFLVVRGRAVCLDGSGRPIDSFLACTEASSRFGFASKEGKLLSLIHI